MSSMRSWHVDDPAQKEEGRPYTFYHYMIDLEHGPCIYKRIAGCGAGTEYYAVTPWGDLYPCHQFVGEDDFRMGDVCNGIERRDFRDEFGRNNIYAHEECADCWAKLYCSGGCAANAYHGTGSISGIYEYGCRLFRKRMECAMMMKVAEAMGDDVEGTEFKELADHTVDRSDGIATAASTIFAICTFSC